MTAQHPERPEPPTPPARRTHPPGPTPAAVSECREFPGRTSQCPLARQLVRTSLRHRVPIAEDAELVVSELFANACRHTASGEPGGTLAVSVSALATGLAVVSVTDQGPTRADLAAGRRAWPELKRATPDSPGWRGLHLVAAVADGWGHTPAEEMGLTVWAAFNVATLSLSALTDETTL